MAVIKQRLLRKNTSGSYDTLHLETSAEMVKMTDGTTAQVKIDDLSQQLSGISVALDEINGEVV